MAIGWRRRTVAGTLPSLGGRVAGGGSGGGGEVVVAELPFDFKAYRGQVTIGTDPVFADIEVDEDITWVSQWGKLVDLTLRFEMPGTSDGSARNFIGQKVWATITGIGITMSGYRQPMTMLYGTTGGNEDDSARLMPFEIAMVNEGDFTQGYVVRNMFSFSMDGEKPQFLKGNEQLITRTYFKDGELTYSADDFT